MAKKKLIKKSIYENKECNKLLYQYVKLFIEKQYVSFKDLKEIGFSNGFVRHHFDSISNLHAEANVHYPQFIADKPLMPKNNKAEDMLQAYAKIVAEKHYVSLLDMTSLGYTVQAIKYHFNSLSNLRREARLKYPKSFFDMDLNSIVSEQHLEQLQSVIKKHKRFIITTAITGCPIDDLAFKSMKNYCKYNNAHILVLVASDPAHNKFAPGHRYGTIDHRLVDDPDCTIVIADIALNNNLHISTVKLSAKHIDPATSMGRIASTDGTFIFASPKQRLKAVPVSNKKFPHFIMTTGAITIPNYGSSSYMSDRSAFIANHDHIMGGLVVEVKDKEIYHFRQLQIDADATIIDLGRQYWPNNTINTIRPEALILGDWHAGSTDPKAFNAWKNLIKLTQPNKIVLHDLFDGISINHHERDNVIKRAQQVNASGNNLQKEINLLTRDIAKLAKLCNELVIVKSNHDEFLNRYLQSGYYVKDPENHRLALDLAAAMMDGHDPLWYAVNQDPTYDKCADKVRWLNRDEDFKIAGIQLSAHGDKGSNGARGNINNLETAYGNCVIGHMHTPQILRGAWVVGTSSYLKLDYNVGPSSWLHSSIEVYSNGTRQMINSIDGNWKL